MLRATGDRFNAIGGMNLPASGNVARGDAMHKSGMLVRFDWGMSTQRHRTVLRPCRIVSKDVSLRIHTNGPLNQCPLLEPVMEDE